MRYLVRYAENRPRLEGDWGGDAWSQADTLEIADFRPESSDHRPQTLARLLYDKNGFFGIFYVRDQYVRCAHSGHMAPTHLDSCVELFLQPESGKGYFNFEFSCGGSLFCSHIVDPTRIPGGFRDYSPLPDTDIRQVAIYHSMPSIVDPEIPEPTEWVLEFFLPASLLEKWVGTMGRLGGREWRGNLYKCGDETSHPHWASWSPVDELNFHLPRCFGTFEFAERSQGTLES